MITDIIALNRTALLESAGIVARVERSDLERATPCAGWTIRDLLAHMTAQHIGFAAAAEGRGDDMAVWMVDPASADPVRDYASAVDRVIAAFAEDGVVDRQFALPEIMPGTTFLGRHAVGFHFIDYIVHSWDVARPLSLPWQPPLGLAEAALPIARAIPNGDERLNPGAAFAPGHEPTVDASAFDEILARVGRSPNWPA